MSLGKRKFAVINEICVHPKPTNNNAKRLTTLFGVLTIIGFVAYFVMSGLDMPYRSVEGMCALILLVVTIMLMTRYIFASLRYDVLFDTEGSAFFLVRQITGKRERTLSRFYLADVESIVRETKEARASYKTEPGFIKYSYMPTLAPAEDILITIRSRYERAVIRIEGSDEFLETLRSFVEEAKALRRIEEDNEEY